MTERRSDDRTHVDALDDRGLIGRVAAAYAPRRLTPSARFALERDLWARIESRRQRAFFRPVLAMVTLVATVLWFARPPTDSDTLTMAAAVIDAWEYDVVFSDPLDEPSFDWAPGAGLPEEYVSIEALIDGDDGDEGEEGYEQ